ncbi:MAG: hypothetical protein WEC59_02410, partial [Salibacteraceae bacterium]
FGSDERYSALLNVLKEFRDSGNTSPYQKEILQKLNLKREDLITLMNRLYQDFQYILITEKTYPITENNILLLPVSGNDTWVIEVNHLISIPRIGETVYLPSLTSDHQGASYFRVEEIIHHIESGVHSIEIHMNDN